MAEKTDKEKLSFSCMTAEFYQAPEFLPCSGDSRQRCGDYIKGVDTQRGLGRVRTQAAMEIPVCTFPYAGPWPLTALLDNKTGCG